MPYKSCDLKRPSGELPTGGGSQYAQHPPRYTFSLMYAPAAIYTITVCRLKNISSEISHDWRNVILIKSHFVPHDSCDLKWPSGELPTESRSSHAQQPSRNYCAEFLNMLHLQEDFNFSVRCFSKRRGTLFNVNKLSSLNILYVWHCCVVCFL